MSKSLHEAETRYLHLEKATLAIIHAIKKLPHYFKTYIVVIQTQLPLQALLWKSDFIRRVAKWQIILRSFDIKYLPRIAVKRASYCQSSGRIH